MINENKKILVEANERINALFKSKLPGKMEVIRYSSDIEKQFVDTINQLIDFIAEISEFITPLSQGKLNNKIPQAKNFLASPFKELHSRLMHLTWQAQQITKGDYNQRVDFMGDFSTAFNSMIVSLEQKDREIKQRIAQLEDKNKEMLYEINERKRAEKTLQASESRLKEAEQLAYMGHWELNLASNALIWSDEIYRIFNADPKKIELTYEVFLDIVHPDDRDFVDKAYTDSVKKKTSYDIIHRLLFKDGTIKYVHEKCHTQYDESGDPVRSLGTVQDITKSIIANKKMQESEEKFRTILETIQECYFEVDLKGNLQFFNDSFCELIGYSKDELQGRNNREFTDKANADKIYKIFHTVYKTEKSVSGASWEFIRKDGTRRYIEASVALIINSEQKRIGFQSVGRDVTQRKQMEIKQEQLIADLQRALGEVKTLHGLLPICASCKKIRDDKGYWNQIESYIQKHSKAKFSHSMCPECSDKLYGTEDWYIEMKENKKNGF